MLIEVRVQLNGKTLREDIYKVATAIRVAKAGMRYAAQDDRCLVLRVKRVT